MIAHWTNKILVKANALKSNLSVQATCDLRRDYSSIRHSPRLQRN